MEVGKGGDYIPIAALSSDHNSKYVHMALSPQKPQDLLGTGRGGRGYGGGGRGRLYTYHYTVTTRMTSALR